MAARRGFYPKRRRHQPKSSWRGVPGGGRKAGIAGGAAVACVGTEFDEAGGAQAGEVFGGGGAAFAQGAGELGGGVVGAVDEDAEEAVAVGFAEEGEEVLGGETGAHRGGRELGRSASVLPMAHGEGERRGQAAQK